MAIGLRVATADDFQGIYDFAMKAISDSILPAFAANAGIDLQDRMMNGETTTVIAEDGADIVAYTELDLSRKNAVFIRGVYVLPSHRRQGIGGKLLNMVRNEFCKSGEKIRVEAFTTEGRQFWESLNFEVSKFIMELNE